MTHTPTPAEIETLRRSVGHHHLLCVRSDEAPYCSCGRDESLAILDRLTPPAPEPDEATKIAREFVARYHARAGYPMMAELARKGEYDKDRSVDVEYLRQAIAELIASKDGEIERLAGINSQLVAEHNAMNQDGARLESELATLQAENERLIATYVKYVAFDQPEAAERNPAEPAKTYGPGPWPGDPDHHETLPAEPWSIRGAGYDPNCEACKGSKFTCDEHFVKPDTDGSRSGGMQPGTNAGAVEVTEADKELWETVWDSGCANEPLEIAKYRAEAEARGRREALKDIELIPQRVKALIGATEQQQNALNYCEAELRSFKRLMGV